MTLSEQVQCQHDAKRMIEVIGWRSLCIVRVDGWPRDTACNKSRGVATMCARTSDEDEGNHGEMADAHQGRVRRYVWLLSLIHI